MSNSAPDTEAVRDAILEALQLQPLTKRELARRLAVQPRTMSGCLTCLVDRGQVVISGGRVGLPGQLDEGEPMTAEEQLHEHFRQLWQRRGIAAICPTDVSDSYLRQQICLLAMQLYGRRWR